MTDVPHRNPASSGGNAKPAIRIERLDAPDATAWQLIEEYYAAVQVVLRDSAASLQQLIDEPGAGMWLAYLDDKAVGCVVLRRLDSIPSASECKRLYVRPEARGHHIAEALMAALEAHARSQGFNWVYLDTHDGLLPAIALYEKLGYESCARYNDNPQATVFFRKSIGTTNQVY